MPLPTVVSSLVATRSNNSMGSGKTKKLLSSLFLVDSKKDVKGKTASNDNGGVAPTKTRSHFIFLESIIVDRLHATRNLMDKRSDATQVKTSKSNIAADAEIRENLRLAENEWEELSKLYEAEAKKKKSKFTDAELDTQRRSVMQLNVEIKLLKETQQTRYSISGATVQNMQTNLTALEKSTYLAPEINDIALTEYQKEQLQQIRNRDADEIEADLDEIADGITLLHELAQRMGAEVTHQDKMLTGINGSIDDAHKSTTENVSKVDKMNQKAKKIY